MPGSLSASAAALTKRPRASDSSASPSAEQRSGRVQRDELAIAVTGDHLGREPQPRRADGANPGSRLRAPAARPRSPRVRAAAARARRRGTPAAGRRAGRSATGPLAAGPRRSPRTRPAPRRTRWPARRASRALRPLPREDKREPMRAAGKHRLAGVVDPARVMERSRRPVSDAAATSSSLVRSSSIEPATIESDGPARPRLDPILDPARQGRRQVASLGLRAGAKGLAQSIDLGAQGRRHRPPARRTARPASRGSASGREASDRRRTPRARRGNSSRRTRTR